MYLSTLFNDFSRSYIQKIIDKGNVLINGKEINKNIKIKNKDELLIKIIIEKSKIEAEDIELDIVFEDDNMIIINKDAGVNTHPVPGEGGKTGTLVNALLNHTKNLSTIGGVERPGIVHRLDKDTSGLIMIAKNDKMMRYLQDKIQKREVDKYYIAIVNGIIKEKNFKIESYIGRHSTDKIKMTVKNPISPKLAITHGKVIDYIDNKYTLVELKLETGRTHQIRVHLSSIGYPIIGDKVYGDVKINKEVYEKYGLQRQALHSYKLKILLYEKEVEFYGDLKHDLKIIVKNKLNY
ncbi:RluA family pseudouridine synthase [Candidatus Gracilibacteria bacterium]|nr:RluA family pseudouridine synthase [Candidatus Gracilibacteria bacterium]